MITVVPDAAGRAGMAQLRFGNAAAQSASLSLRIQREGWDEGTLGPNGWQGEDAWLQPEEVATDGGDLLLTVGWDICKHLQADTYVVSLSRPGTEAPAAWPDIRPVRTPPRARPRSGETAAAGTAPLKAAEPSAVRVASAILPPPLSPPQSAAPTERSEATAAAAGFVDHTWRYLLALGALSLLVLAGAGYWYWRIHGIDRRTQAAAASTPVAATPVAPAPASPPTSLPAPATPVQPAPARALSDMSVPDVLAHAPDVAAVAAEGRRRLAGQQHDDGLLLLEEAADRGDGTAKAALGSLYDPVGFQPGGVLAHPDARQAARYYQSAERADAPGIAAKREALRTWLQAKSAVGDLEAGLVLKDFWP